MFNLYENWFLLGMIIFIIKTLYSRSTDVKKISEYFVLNKIAKIIYFYDGSKNSKIPLENIPKNIIVEILPINKLSYAYNSGRLNLGTYADYFQIRTSSIVGKNPLLIILFDENMKHIDGSTEKYLKTISKKKLNESNKYVKFIKIRLESRIPIKFSDINNQNSSIEWSCFSQNDSPFKINKKGIFYISQPVSKSNQTPPFDYDKCLQNLDEEYQDGQIDDYEYDDGVAECKYQDRIQEYTNNRYAQQIDLLFKNDKQRCRKMVNSYLNTDSGLDRRLSVTESVESVESNSRAREFSKETDYM
jgi:hypothetical protein